MNDWLRQVNDQGLHVELREVFDRPPYDQGNPQLAIFRIGDGTLVIDLKEAAGLIETLSQAAADLAAYMVGKEKSDD